jgi:hypothetical protein
MYIYSLLSVYGSAKDYIQVVKRLFIVGGKIFYGGEKLYCSLFSIVLRFQLIVTGRAKILPGVELFLLNHMSLYICMCKNVGYMQPKGCL